MTVRLQQIERLYHAALEHDESKWEAFLDAECPEDGDLRREVGSLLFYSKYSEYFIESSALETIAKELANAQSQEQAENNVVRNLEGSTISSME